MRGERERSALTGIQDERLDLQKSRSNDNENVLNLFQDVNERFDRRKIMSRGHRILDDEGHSTLDRGMDTCLMNSGFKLLMQMVPVADGRQ